MKASAKCMNVNINLFGFTVCVFHLLHVDYIYDILSQDKNEERILKADD